MHIEDLEEKLHTRIVDAFNCGLSVIEITRTLNRSSAAHIHNLLRDTGHIDTIKKEGLRRSYGIDGKWESELRRKGYSFVRWCAGWGFDPEPTSREIATGEIGKAHEALKRDFPSVYARMFGERPPQRVHAARIHDPHPSVKIEWHPDRNAFVAELIGNPEINASGIDLEHALERFQTVLRLDESIKRLDSMIGQFQC